MTTPTTTAPAPSPVVVWEWRNDLSMWEVYDPGVVAFIETSHASNPTGFVSLAGASPSLAAYQVDFNQGDLMNV